MTGAELALVCPGAELDWASLETWLRQRFPELEGHFAVLRFPKGSANLTYPVRLGEAKLVVRRPPFGRLPEGGRDMGREWCGPRGLRSARGPAAAYFGELPDNAMGKLLRRELRARLAGAA